MFKPKMRLILPVLTLHCIILQSCSVSSEPNINATKQNVSITKQTQDLENNNKGNEVTAMESPESNIKFEVTGTVVDIEIKDISKRSGIQKFHTYVTLKVEETLPTDIVSKLTVDELSLSRPTETDIDEQISTGDKVTITIIANNLSNPDFFRINEIKKKATDK